MTEKQAWGCVIFSFVLWLVGAAIAYSNGHPGGAFVMVVLLAVVCYIAGATEFEQGDKK